MKKISQIVIMLTMLMAYANAGAYPGSTSRSSEQRDIRFILQFMEIDSDLSRKALRELGVSSRQMDEYYENSAQTLSDFLSTCYYFDMEEYVSKLREANNNGWQDKLMFHREGKVICRNSDYLNTIMSGMTFYEIYHKMTEEMFTLFNLENMFSMYEFPPLQVAHADGDICVSLFQLFGANSEIRHQKTVYKCYLDLWIEENGILISEDSKAMMMNEIYKFIDNYYFFYASKVYPMVFSKSELDSLVSLYRTNAGLNLVLSDHISFDILFQGEYAFLSEDNAFTRYEKEFLSHYSELDTPTMRKFQAYYPFVCSKIMYMMDDALSEIIEKYI